MQDSSGHTDLYGDLSKISGGANGMSSVVPSSIASSTSAIAAYHTQLSIAAAAAALGARHTVSAAAGVPDPSVAAVAMASHHDLLHDYHTL